MVTADAHLLQMLKRRIVRIGKHEGGREAAGDAVDNVSHFLTAPIDNTLRWVIVGFRLVAIVWMGALVGATLATDEGANQVVVGATYAGALAWTGVTVAHALHPRWFRTPAWVVADGLVDSDIRNEEQIR